LRVPTPNVSVVDLNATLEKPASADAVNAAFKAASEGALKGILEYVTAPLVSVDFRGNPHSAMLDAAYTKVLGQDFRESAGVVRQRMGLFEPLRGSSALHGRQGPVGNWGTGNWGTGELGTGELGNWETGNGRADH
jgi:hypothetical protein